MQVLEITIENAKSAFIGATAEGKALLKKLFPSAVLSGDIRDEINGWDDIERITGKKLTLRDGETVDEFAYRQNKLIAEAYNQGVVLDPLNTKQYKYFPWHQISGSALSYCDYGSWFGFECRRSPLLC